MSPERLDESAFRRLMRVRLGKNGPRGRLMHCEKKDRSGWYWKVKLETGEWAWPADIHIDGPGELVARCQECRLPFLCKVIEPLCRYCDEAAFGTSQRADEPHHIRVAERRSHWQHGGRHRI